jgi:SAM-dependent methyltransferase
MAPEFRHVDAIDVEPERLALFKSNNTFSNIHIHQMSADRMNFSENSFDAITAIEVLEHVVDTAAVLREVFRTLKPGGWFALTTPNRLWPLEQHGYKWGSRWLPGWTFPGLVWFPPLHRRLSDADAFTVGYLKDLLRRSGLEPIGSRYLFPPLDRFRDGHILHVLMSALEKSPFRVFSQTVIVVARKRLASSARAER